MFGYILRPIEFGMSKDRYLLSSDCPLYPLELEAPITSFKDLDTGTLRPGFLEYTSGKQDTLIGPACSSLYFI